MSKIIDHTEVEQFKKNGYNIEDKMFPTLFDVG
jgi:hypothetical protein